MINRKPDFIFESSWEVCNKVGGIYTVLSTRAQTLQNYLKDQVIFIGPYFGEFPMDFEEDNTLFTEWRLYAGSKEGLAVKVGRWKVPGAPIVILVDYKPFFSRKNDLYFQMWDKFQVDSSQAYGDYDESCIFAYAVGKVVESFYHYNNLKGKSVIAHMNEWMLGMGALYIQHQLPEIATVFTTHATTIGRSIAGNNKNLYADMTLFNGDIMAKELNVWAKHSLEKQTAHHVDAFTTVSDITACECKELLDKAPDVVTPNGFDPRFVPSPKEFDTRRQDARTSLINMTEKLLGYSIDKDAYLIATSGRNEYRNKGLDVFIDSINKLRKEYTSSKETIAFIIVPGWVKELRADLKAAIEQNLTVNEPMQLPFITHWLNQMSEDRILNFILQSGFTNSKEEKVKIIFIPSYVDENDGLFNKSYYDLLIGMDATVFPSYYEPWGYTPLESIAFGIPTVTTSLSGFGQWVKSLNAEGEYDDASSVVERTDYNYDEVVGHISNTLSEWREQSASERGKAAQRCFQLAELATWDKFISYYAETYEKALAASRVRRKQLISV